MVPKAILSEKAGFFNVPLMQSGDFCRLYVLIEINNSVVSHVCNGCEICGSRFAGNIFDEKRMLV